MEHLKNLAAIPLVIAALAGCEKHSLDRQMQELCAKDGGIRVYETVKLPSVLFDPFGDPYPGWRSRPDEQRLGEGYSLARETTVLKDGDPMKGQGRLSRYEYRIIRSVDKKILGEAILYGRAGGDIFAFGHFTSKGCPEKLGAPTTLIRQVFINAEGN
ncbi:hypothetical protein [Caenimonas sp. SL110]|uniref:hypothetical protein n=1 Tax=Caenimonas sp. SL110 TaxID=1450524 RepID=UPI00128B520E|nr:hypothetical protein [Caenimonas sp. SL110]